MMRVKMIIFVVALAAICSAQFARAQGSFDREKTMKALKELQKRTTSRKERPASRPHNPIRLRKSEHQELRLMPDAPTKIRKWFAKLPELRQQHIAHLKWEIEDARQKYREIKRRDPGSVTTYDSFGGAHQVASPAGMAARAKAAHEQLIELRRLQRTLRSAEKDHAQIYVPRLHLSVGEYGSWNYQAKILQIIGKFDARVSFGGTGVWMAGFDFSQYTDGEYISINMPVIVTGTKRYTTTIGGSNTIYVIKPFPVKDYVYTVTVTDWINPHGQIVKTEIKGEMPAATQPTPASENPEDNSKSNQSAKPV